MNLTPLTTPAEVAKPGKALITGSAAPFADRLVERLEALGWEVSTILHTSPNLLPPTHAWHLPVSEPDPLYASAADVDAVILLSGIDSLTSMIDDSRDLDAVLGNLTPGATLVEVTSMAVFGNAGDIPVTEADSPAVPDELDPVAACEVRVLAADDWLRSVVVRPGLVYGDRGGLALGPAVDFVRTHGVSRYFGDGSDSVPTVHEDDLLDLLTRVVADPSARGIYHAVSGTATTRDLAQWVASAAGTDAVEPWDTTSLQAHFGETVTPPRVSVLTSSDGRAARELDWDPTAETVSQALTP